MGEPFKSIDRIFFNDGYSLAEEITGACPDVENVNTLSDRLYAGIDSLIDAFSDRAAQENQQAHCARGCHWCCSQAVFINPLEVIFLNRYIQTRFNEDKIALIRAGLEEKHARTTQMELNEKLSFKFFCPLLENKACSVYPARPMACRIYLSMDVKSCIHEYRMPEDKTVFARLFEFPLHAGRMMNEGIASLLREHGLHMNEITLEHGLLTLLQNPGFTADWLIGQQVFPEAAATDEEQKPVSDYFLDPRKGQQSASE